MKKLRQIAGGDTYTIVYLKMMLLSLQSSGILEFDETGENIIEDLALDIDEDVINVKATVIFLRAQGLLEEHDSYSFFLPEVLEFVGSETPSAQRKRAQRKRDSSKVVTLSQPSHKSVQYSHTETEKETNKELYLDTHTDIDDVEEWVKEKAKNAQNPIGYQITMRQALASHDDRAQKEFAHWKIKKKQREELSLERKIEDDQTKINLDIQDPFDFLKLIGMVLDGRTIIDVVFENALSTIDVWFEDGGKKIISKADAVSNFAELY